ncbi:MAG: peptide deformylase [Candidatus Omnitrophota bacterium]
MNKTRLRIRLLGDYVLRKKAKPVLKITQEHRDNLSQMARLMYDSLGVGLAAPQVGINQKMLVADIGSGLYKLINPKIVRKEGHQIQEEGCLSVPGICVKIKRAKKIKVEALDEYSARISVEAEDLLACVFQHEIDHLNGKLIVDYASFMKRVKIKKKIEEFKKKSKDEELPESETKSCKLQL